MKKRILLLLFVFPLLLAGNLSSCSNEGEATTGTVAAPDEQTARIGENPILFTYNSVATARTNASEAVLDLIDEGLRDIPTIPNCSVIAAHIDITNGRGTLEDYYHIDASNQVIAWYVLNHTTNQYESKPLPVSPLNSGCPAGYSQIAMCPINNLYNCVYGSIDSYVHSNLSMTFGDQVQFTIAIAGNGIRVCAN